MKIEIDITDEEFQEVEQSILTRRILVHSGIDRVNYTDHILEKILLSVEKGINK
jgi:hypothetical protein